MALNPKRQRFVEEFLVDLNGKQAAIRAGYKPRAAEQQATRLLRDAQVQAEVTRLQGERASRTGATADRVVRELMRIAFVDRRKLFAWGPTGITISKSEDLDDDAAALIEEVSQTVTEAGGTIRIKTASKTDALKMLGQHLGIFVDRVELTNKAKVILTEEIVDGAPNNPPA